MAARDPGPETFTLFVKMLTGKTITAEVPRDGCVRDLMEFIRMREGYEHGEQRLVFCGRQLQADERFSGLDKLVREGMCHLVLKFSLTIELADKRTFDVTSNSTVGEAKLGAKKRFPELEADVLQLLYEGRELEDDQMKFKDCTWLPFASKLTLEAGLGVKSAAKLS